MGEARGRVVLTVAPNGGRKTKADHPALPLAADELARTAAECLERGASMIHIHVRDAEGRHCLDPEAYRVTIAHICQEVGDRLVLQITSESIGRYSPAEQRAAVLKTNPEAVSLALGELAPEASDERTSAYSSASSSRCASGLRSFFTRLPRRSALARW
jgi:3-keto-5-aminohexanoate cleavage enzyme